MREIPLTQGKVALVDDADYEWISQYKWCAWKTKRGYWYAVRTEGHHPRHQIFMHRQILNTPKGMETDHINRDGLNNQRYNIRICTKAENRRNQIRQKRKALATFKGVRTDKYGRRWRAQIMVDNRPIHVGCFPSALEAAKAYDAAALEYHGEFARLNFPIGSLVEEVFNGIP